MTKYAKYNGKYAQYGGKYAKKVPTYLEILNDGRTEAWYLSDTSIVMDASNYVSRWNDMSGRNRAMTGLTTAKPLWSSTGILFDGINDRMATSTINPSINSNTFNVYFVAKIVTYVDYGELFDLSYDCGLLRLQLDSTNVNLYYLKGTPSTVRFYNVYEKGVCGLFQLVINGANSYIKYNNAAASTVFNPGTTSINSLGIGVNSWGNIEVQEWIVRSTVDSSEYNTIIKNYLYDKYTMYGSEMISQGTFDASTKWNTTGGWSITGGKATFDNVTDGNLIQADSSMVSRMENNMNYKLEFDVSGTTGGGIYMYVYNAADNRSYVLYSQYNDGHKILYFTSKEDTVETGGGILFHASNVGDSGASIDNISLKKQL